MSGAKTIAFLNPRTCGIYKDGGIRYKTDPATGRRTTEVDNELLEQVDSYLARRTPPGTAHVSIADVFDRHVLVPTYFDDRYNAGIRELLNANQLGGITIGELLDTGVILERRGHGSPSNDQRSGHIPYIKVSDIRGLRVNINPTNLVSETIAAQHWRGRGSGLEAWDLVTPNRASSNIGEFAILLPGEERVVLTKEVFVFRVVGQAVFDPFYLLWAFSLKAVRDQWRRVALMQTNREDCGERYREVVLPNPPDKTWAEYVSEPFRSYFMAIAEAKRVFVDKLQADSFQYVANAASFTSQQEQDETNSS